MVHGQFLSCEASEFRVGNVGGAMTNNATFLLMIVAYYQQRATAFSTSVHSKSRFAITNAIVSGHIIITCRRLYEKF